MTDYANRRRMMVDNQIRPADVTKFPVIAAMLDVPREAFTPESLLESAYAGANVPLAPGRVMLDPRTLAKMLDGVNPGSDEMVLDLGCGYGYSSAVTARMAQVVVAVEEDEAMAREAQERLSELGADNVIVHEGTLTAGAAEHGPFDVILVQGGVAVLPDAITGQLKDGGRIACIFMDGALGTVRIGYKSNGRMDWRFAFHAGAPVLPGFEKEEAFAL